MNNAAIVPYIGMHALQIQNVKRNVVKKASIQQLNNETPPVQETENRVQEVSQQLPTQMQDNLGALGTEIEAAPNDNSMGARLD